MVSIFIELNMKVEAGFLPARANSLVERLNPVKWGHLGSISQFCECLVLWPESNHPTSVGPKSLGNGKIMRLFQGVSAAAKLLELFRRDGL